MRSSTRIDAIDARVRAYITPLRDRAMAAARRAEAEIAAGLWRGPLHGVGFAVKDNYFTAGIRTTGGSRLMLTSPPTPRRPSSRAWKPRARSCWAS